MIKAPIDLQDLSRGIYAGRKVEPSGPGGVGGGRGPTAESAAALVGPISLGVKRAGERSAGNPPAPFEVAGVGDGFTAGLVRHSQRKRGATDRPGLQNTAPALDPTGDIRSAISRPPQRRPQAAWYANPRGEAVRGAPVRVPGQQQIRIRRAAGYFLDVHLLSDGRMGRPLECATFSFQPTASVRRRGGSRWRRGRRRPSCPEACGCACRALGDTFRGVRRANDSG